MNQEGDLHITTTQRRVSALVQMAMAIVTIVWGVGCQTNSYRKGDVAGKSLRSAADEVQRESRAIDATVAALNDLVTNPSVDLKPQYQRFSAALNRLVASAAQMEITRKNMEEKNAEYFAAWERNATNINFGIIRERSESRMAEVTNRFFAVNSRYVEAQNVIRPLITYFTDIRTALSMDLTAAGLESVKSIANNADQNSRKVQIALGQLSDELATSGASLSSVVFNIPEQSSDHPRISVRSEISNGPPVLPRTNSVALDGE